MNNLNSILKSPAWTMDDAYGDLRAPRYEQSVTELEVIAKQLGGVQSVDASNVEETLSLYEKATCLSSSLLCFIKCMGAKNASDDRVSDENSRIIELQSRVENNAQRLFQFLATLDEDDSLWENAPLSNWKFELGERKKHWKQSLSAENRAVINDFERMMFLPLGEVYKSLQKGIDIPAINSQGDVEHIRASKLISVLKGSPDRQLRASTFEGMERSYEQRGALYAALLNELHGYRLIAFGKANKTPLEVSLHQNRMSKEALMAMREAILSNIDLIRESVTLRAPYFGVEKLGVYDLTCPPPKDKDKSDPLIPFEEGIDIVRKALAAIGPEMGDFIDLMVKNQWIEATVSDNKIGGAFYSRFNEFKMPRIFTHYMGTITTILQQAHENGHAFHYWTIRDLPTIQTEFPMTLTEMASTFNEAAIRKYLTDTAGDNEELRFDMLWQELRSVAHYLMNTMVRFDFELKYFEERQKGTVNASRCVELMRECWNDWYGDTTDGVDNYMWANKLHYYKTDQHIYNYPYCVGYLLSARLMYEKQRRGDGFIHFYKALLRDTGRMTLDDLIAKHFGENASSITFWQNCMSDPLNRVVQFREKYSRNS